MDNADKRQDEEGERDGNILSEGKSLQNEENGQVSDKSKIMEDDTFSRSENSSSGKQNVDSRKRSAEIACLDDCLRDTVESGASHSKKRFLLSGSSTADDSIHMPESSGLTIQQLVEHIQTVKKKGLLAEYAHIRMEPYVGTFTHSRAKHNLHKNRYTDVFCYDHSRVTLAQSEGVSTSDYINASLVDGYRQKNAYISTQGPLPKTFADFWRMVWQYQCQVIVMTTRTVERQRIKCGQYWPCEEQTEDQFGEFTVFNKSVTSFNSFVETRLILHNSNTCKSREVRHLQFLSWPDFGVPPAASFLDFLFHVRSVQRKATENLGSSWTGPPQGPPMVVHCSAGIGRTGTFITVDICLHRLEDTSTVDVPATVRRIRSQRAFSIQMPDQYVFCHLAIIKHASRTGLVNDMVSADILDSCDCG